MRVLGISAFYHDSAAALVVDGRIVAAAQEERFSRVKHDAGFPAHAIQFCLQEGGLVAQDVDKVVFYEKPFPKFERLLETYFAFAPRGFRSFATSMPVWLTDKLFQKRFLVRQLREKLGSDVDWNSRLLFSEHHLSHAASAFYPSPFDASAILTMDGVGEWPTTSLAIGRGADIKILREIHFPHSLGLLYSSFTFFTGFKVNSGEYKLMGLAPYGKPVFADLIRDNLIMIAGDGSFQLNMDYFAYATGLRMTNDRFAELFGGPPRAPEDPLTQREMDLAASIQLVTEEVVVALGRSIAEETGERNLCLAGGVALNCVANGVLLREGFFDQIFIQPAAGDAGGALGAAMAVEHLMEGRPRSLATGRDGMRGSYLGPSFSQSEVEKRLTNLGAEYTVMSDHELLDATARALADGKAVGWMQGRMEFGPRALGARSILADPRSPDMQRLLNLKIKYRESFRPFAPSILAEDCSDWFELEEDSPYMLVVSPLRPEHRRTMSESEHRLFGIDKLNVPRSTVPAITHVDYSARIQTVHPDTNPRYHRLIELFKELTGCPMLVNTSFNVRGEPIVCTPEDAFRCFMGTQLDVLVIENAFLQKAVQDTRLSVVYKDEHELD